MPDEDKEHGRRIVRRSRMGFQFSSPSVDDSTSTTGGNVNSEVSALLTHTPDVQAPAPMPGDNEFNPRNRMDQVRRRASEYEKEYRLNLLHRMIMRNVAMDEIAEQLGISIAQVYRDRQELKAKLRKDSASMDINDIIGDSKGFYEEAAALGMRAASMPNLPMPIRLAGVRTGLAAKNDMHRFFQTAGVYDVLRYRTASDGSGVSDVRRLMDNTERLLSGEGLSLSDSEADSGSAETIDL